MEDKSGAPLHVLQEHPLAPKERTFGGPGHCLEQQFRGNGTEPSAQSFEHPLKETSPLERRVADMPGPPHILLLVGEGLRREGSSASFSGKS